MGGCASLRVTARGERHRETSGTVRLGPTVEGILRFIHTLPESKSTIWNADNLASQSQRRVHFHARQNEMSQHSPGRWGLITVEDEAASGEGSSSGLLCTRLSRQLGVCEACRRRCLYVRDATAAGSGNPSCLLGAPPGASTRSHGRPRVFSCLRGHTAPCDVRGEREGAR